MSVVVPTPVVKVLSVDQPSLEKLRSTFVRNAGNLVFRRVRHVVTKPQDLVETVVEKIVDGSPCATYYKPGDPTEPEIFTSEEWLQNVELRYSKFSFFTTAAVLRGNDKIGRIEIYGASNNYREIDFFDKCDFRLAAPKKVLGADPLGTALPRQGDLVCGLVSRAKPGRRNPEYKFWFTCSEQFFRAWTAVMYEDHESLAKKCGDGEDEIRRHLMSGNRLATNGFRKWTLGCQHSLVESNLAELSKRFYRLHTESSSREWVHVYAALVLIMRYQELPGLINVPNNLDSSPKMTRWDLPDGWIEKLISAYGLVIVEKDRLVGGARPVIPTTHMSIVLDPETKELNVDFSKEHTGTDDHCPPIVNVSKLDLADPCQFPKVGDVPTPVPEEKVSGCNVVTQIVKRPELTLEHLAQFPLHRQQAMLGDKLYRLVEETHPLLTGKITGMLLDALPVEQLFALIQDRPLLAAKIQEAINVLHLAKAVGTH